MSRCSTSERPQLTAAPRHYGSGGGGRNCAVAHGSPRSGTHRALIRRRRGGGATAGPLGTPPPPSGSLRGRGHDPPSGMCSARSMPGVSSDRRLTALFGRLPTRCRRNGQGRHPRPSRPRSGGGRSRLAYAALPGRAPGRARPGEAEPEQHARTSRRRQQDPPPINYLPRRVLTAATTPPTAQPTTAHSARVATNAAMTPASVSASQRPTAKGSSSTRLT